MRNTAATNERTPGAVILREETTRYAALHPRSAELALTCREHFFAGVPLHWMTDWPLPFPLFIDHARGASLFDVDGMRYADFCLGDTGAMFGHSPPAVAAAIAKQAERGLTTMLPTADAGWVGQELTRRFGLAHWQVTATASDANRFLLRWARGATKRQITVVFDGCYHGAVDESQVRLQAGQTRPHPGLVGSVASSDATRVIEFNDVAALRAALAPGDVAAVLCEPTMTNIGMVLPDAGYLAEVRACTTAHGTLLILDETHTLSSGVGGYAREHGLAPDALVIGKAIAGGVPCAVYGVSAALSESMSAAWRAAGPGRTGIGTTLSGNPLQLAALRANLAEVMTEPAFARMFEGATRLTVALRATIAKHSLPWSVTRVGARLELQFTAVPPRTGREAEQAFDHTLGSALHLFLLNRGVVVTPFHQMMLISPATRDQDIDRLAQLIEEFVAKLKTCDAQPPPV